MKIDLGKIAKEKGKQIAIWLFSMISLALVAKWDAVISTFDKGVQIEAQSEFNSQFIVAIHTDSVAQELLENEEFMMLFLESPVVKQHISDIGVELHDEIVKQIVEDDDTKVKKEDFISASINMHPDSLLAFQVRFWKKVKKNQLASKKDVKNIIKKEVRPEARTVPKF